MPAGAPDHAAWSNGAATHQPDSPVSAHSARHWVAAHRHDRSPLSRTQSTSRQQHREQFHRKPVLGPGLFGSSWQPLYLSRTTRLVRAVERLMSVLAINISGRCRRRRCRRDFHRRRWRPGFFRCQSASSARVGGVCFTVMRPLGRWPDLRSTATIGYLHDTPLFSSKSLLAKQLRSLCGFWMLSNAWWNRGREGEVG